MKGFGMTTEADVIAYMTRQGFALTPALTLAPETPEGTLLAEVRKLAKVNGWKMYHTYDSRKSEAGMLDVFLCDGIDILIKELKTNTGKLTDEQAIWLNLLQHTGKVEAGIWRPCDFPQIAARLTRQEQP